MPANPLSNPQSNPRSHQAERVAEAWSCIAEAESWAVPDCPDCQFVLEALKRGVDWELREMRA